MDLEMFSTFLEITLRAKTIAWTWTWPIKHVLHIPWVIWKQVNIHPLTNRRLFTRGQMDHILRWCNDSTQGGFAAVAMKENHISLCRAGWCANCLSPGDAEMRGVIVGVEELGVTDADFVSDSTDVVWFPSLWNASFTAFSQRPGWSPRFILSESIYNKLLADTLVDIIGPVIEWTRFPCKLRGNGLIPLGPSQLGTCMFPCWFCLHLLPF